MWFGKYYSYFDSFFDKYKTILFVIIAICVGLWLQFILKNQFKLDSKLPLGRGINPPSVSLFVYAILMSLLFYTFDKIIHSIKNLTPIFNIYVFLCKIGKHTLFIFLFHIFYMTKLNSIIGDSLDAVPIIKSIIYITAMILFSVATEHIYILLVKYKDNVINQFIFQQKKEQN